jgi:hypothetical protein
MRHNSKFYVWIIFTLVCGIILGFVISAFMKSNINQDFFNMRFIEIIELAIYIIGLTFFGYYLTVRNSKDARRRDFIYDRINEIRHRIEIDFSTIKKDLKNYNDKAIRQRILMSCRTLSNGVGILKKAIVKRDNHQEQIKKLDQYVEELKDLLTGDTWDSIEELNDSEINSVDKTIRNINYSLDEFTVGLFLMSDKDS